MTRRCYNILIAGSFVTTSPSLEVNASLSSGRRIFFFKLWHFDSRCLFIEKSFLKQPVQDSRRLICLLSIEMNFREGIKYAVDHLKAPHRVYLFTPINQLYNYQLKIKKKELLSECRKQIYKPFESVPLNSFTPINSLKSTTSIIEVENISYHRERQKIPEVK